MDVCYRLTTLDQEGRKSSRQPRPGDFKRSALSNIDEDDPANNKHDGVLSPPASSAILEDVISNMTLGSVRLAHGNPLGNTTPWEHGRCLMFMLQRSVVPSPMCRHACAASEG